MSDISLTLEIVNSFTDFVYYNMALRFFLFTSFLAILSSSLLDAQQGEIILPNIHQYNSYINFNNLKLKIIFLHRWSSRL